MNSNKILIPIIILLIIGAYLLGKNQASITNLSNSNNTIPSKTPSVTQLAASPSSNQNQAPDFTAFAKGWSKHGFGIKINTDGSGEASWRTYKWCSDDPTPPCDSMEGNNIIDGGKATIKLSSVNGSTASGQVTSSSEPNVLIVAPLTLTILEYGMLELDQGSSKLSLCGPEFAKLAPESVLKTLPCGV